MPWIEKGVLEFQTLKIDHCRYLERDTDDAKRPEKLGHPKLPATETPKLSKDQSLLELSQSIEKDFPISKRSFQENDYITESQNSKGWKGPLWVI